MQDEWMWRILWNQIYWICHFCLYFGILFAVHIVFIYSKERKKREVLRPNKEDDLTRINSLGFIYYIQWILSTHYHSNVLPKLSSGILVKLFIWVIHTCQFIFTWSNWHNKNLYLRVRILNEYCSFIKSHEWWSEN